LALGKELPDMTENLGEILLGDRRASRSLTARPHRRYMRIDLLKGD
jgi:hypothetical protein